MKTASLLTETALLLVSSLTVMPGAPIAPALPPLQNYFAGTENAGFWVRLVLTVPALFIVLAAPVAGAVADRWGRTNCFCRADLAVLWIHDSGRKFETEVKHFLLSHHPDTVVISFLVVHPFIPILWAATKGVFVS